MPAIDDFSNYSDGLESPLRSAASVTPSDTSDLSHVTRALFLGSGGELRVRMQNGTVVVFSGMDSGWHPLRVRQIFSTGTTATAIVACW